MILASLIGFSIGIDQFIHVQRHFPVTKQNIVVTLVATTSKITSVEKRVALTFDDGPYGTSTSQILDILERENVPATFFVIGKNVEQYPDQIIREITDGDIIGNHSYSHAKNLAMINPDMLREDISRAQNVITQVSGKVTHLFRPPYSRTSNSMLRELQSEGYVFSGWSIDPRDWDNNNSSTTIVSNVLNYMRPDGIVIFHDGHEKGWNYSRENTIQALPVIIDELKRQGYTFVTVDRILGTNPYR